MQQVSFIVQGAWYNILRSLTEEFEASDQILPTGTDLRFTPALVTWVTSDGDTYTIKKLQKGQTTVVFYLGSQERFLKEGPSALTKNQYKIVQTLNCTTYQYAGSEVMV